METICEILYALNHNNYIYKYVNIIYVLIKCVFKEYVFYKE